MKNEQGFTLVDAMIISGLLLAMIGAFAAYQFNRSKELQAQDARAVYNQLQHNLKSGAAQTQSVSKSEELSFDNIH